MNCKRIIPDAITSCNLLCGSIAVFLATQGAFIWAFVFILGGAFFDFFDGLSARLLKAPSPIGIQLDSLADVITFGLAPSMMLFCWLKPLLGWWALIALIMAACSALRLAKFNVDERQHNSFIGLATPPNAIFWGALCCMPYAVLAYDWMAWVLLGCSLISGWLLNAEIPFFSFKSWHKDKMLIICFLAGCAILFIFCLLKAIETKHIEFALFSGTAIIIWYVALNLLLACLPKRKH
ncbi:MAG: CDP-diacylglycerol--serine O-phosphatidyltransferase [Paludibacteraceae bacterium]|nr:CDP-diacylglycerol--serine O-phosphatidyltransferase [Paludibacteraceae bacterium]